MTTQNTAGLVAGGVRSDIGESKMYVKILNSCRIKSGEKVINGEVGKVYPVTDELATELAHVGQAEIVDGPEEDSGEEESKKAPAKKGAAK